MPDIEITYTNGGKGTMDIRPSPPGDYLNGCKAVFINQATDPKDLDLIDAAFDAAGLTTLPSAQMLMEKMVQPMFNEVAS